MHILKKTLFLKQNLNIKFLSEFNSNSESNLVNNSMNVIIYMGDRANQGVGKTFLFIKNKCVLHSFL